jgi:hypothetical protein
MKAVFLFILNGLVLLSFGQTAVFNYNAKNKQAPVTTVAIPSISTRPAVQITHPVAVPQYDIQKVNKNLKLDRRLIISGAVLTGTGGIIFGVGLASMFATRADENFLAFALLMTGAPLIGTGVPLLGVGLAQRHKWRQRKTQLNIQTGILSNAHLGLVMQY